MKMLSLKLRDEVFDEVEEVIKKFKVPRNTYINEALAFYNKVNRRRLLKKKLAAEVSLAKASALTELGEWDGLADEGIE